MYNVNVKKLTFTTSSNALDGTASAGNRRHGGRANRGKIRRLTGRDREMKKACIPHDEFEQRIANIRRAMEERELDAF